MATLKKNLKILLIQRFHEWIYEFFVCSQICVNIESYDVIR